MVGIQTEAPRLAPSGGLRAHYAATSPEQQIFRPLIHSQVITDEELGIVGFVRPSIAFQPSWQDYLARSHRLSWQRKWSGAALPALAHGFPSEIRGPRVWSGKEISSVNEFVVQLSAGEIDEIDSALTYFKDNGPNEVSKETFPLPVLGSRLEHITEDLHMGRGVTILRGLDPSKYTAWENVVLFAGLAAYIADRIGVQERSGSFLTHLTDMAHKFGKQSKRTPAFSSEALPFHNDVCDILALYVQELAADGGETTLASSAAIYNEIASLRPDIVKTLAASKWVYDEETKPEEWAPRPLLFPEPTHGPFFCFNRQKLTGTPNNPLLPEVPPMTEDQAEALDTIHFLAEKHGINVPLQKGDVMFSNNLALLHGRQAFSDQSLGGGSVEHQRHILRLWVRNQGLAWETPKSLENEWHAVYGNSDRRAKAHWLVDKDRVDRSRVIGHKATCN